MPASVAFRPWLWLFVLVLGGSFFVGLGSWGVLESSEARYAEIGREMLAGADWLHPRLLGIQHFHKPPLTYWLTAAGLMLAGPTAFGVRLLPVLAVLGQVGLVYGLGLLLFAQDRARALAAAVVYGTLPLVLISALNVTTDAYLQTLELAATYGILRYYHDGGRRWLYLFWVGLGLAFLTKGPVGFVLPLMAVSGFYFRRQQARRPFTVHHALGLALFGLVGLSWYLYLMAENPAFVRYFLFQHTVERFANPETFGRSKPWWFYLLLAPATSLPWSAALLTQAGRTRWQQVPQQWRNVLFFWVLIPLAFFSLSSSKLLLYVLPVFPGVALLTVYYLGRLSDAALHGWYLGISFFFALLLAALCLLPLFVPMLPVALELSPATALWPAVGIVLLVLQQALWDQVRVAPRLLVVATIFTAALLLTAKPILRQNQLAFNGSRPLADLLRRHHLENQPILVYDELLPSLAFELGRLPVSLHDGSHNLTRETQFEPARSWQQNLVYLTDSTQDSYVRRLLTQHPVLLVKGDVRPERQWLVQAFPIQEKVGDWTVYSSGW
ncbi:glycosyltransferase family 39 protein [Hymenobacter algoricola]|uniref:Glycosyltransferase family 39 protein n=1 Tax=Hymenobacter algoricola TaxID=486267 RepID=A0ABP7MM97_9BACT